MADEAAFKRLQPGDFYRAYIEQGKRPDGRGSLTSFRPVSISVGSIGTADGSAIVKQGETTVVCGIKLELAEPKPETPDEGYVVPNLDLGPICHQQFKPGPPSELAQSASYFIMEAINNSKLIETKNLCIEAGKLVWVVYIDLICLNFGGNILDVSLKAVVAAMRSLTVPQVRVIKNEEVAHESEEIKVDPENRTPMKIHPNLPYSCTIAVFDHDQLLVDPTEEEEQLSSAVVTVVVQLPTDTGSAEICHFHKPGGSAISRETLQKCCSLAKKQAKQIKKLVDTAAPVPKFK